MSQLAPRILKFGALGRRRSRKPRLRIACVHQGYELYGSDRSFVSSVASLRAAFPQADVRVILPRSGPIQKALEGTASRIDVHALWILRKRHIRRLLGFGLFTLPVAVVRAVATFWRSDLVYINTITPLDYLLAACLFRRRALLHIRELPVGIERRVIAALVRFCGVPTIYNSQATRNAFDGAAAKAPSYVLYNGYAGPEEWAGSDYDGARPLRLLMLGRINRFKGQDLLIEACARLPTSLRKQISVRIVGETFEADLVLERELRKMSADAGCTDIISFEPFQQDPSETLRWCDLVVVPSRRPEPFGRVPIEAMSHARGSIVAAHGGLIESVQDGKTGWHFPPNDPADLAKAIQAAVEHPQLVRQYGLNGRQVFENRFRQGVIDRELSAIFGTLLPPKLPVAQHSAATDTGIASSATAPHHLR